MIDHVAMTSDYVRTDGDPEPYLRAIADAGFRHVHWCQQWNTDFLYGEAELRHVERCFEEFGLSLNDLHASRGVEKAWGSPVEYRRQAGVELVRNRIDMARRLACDVVIMHAPPECAETGNRDACWTAWSRSLDELQPYAADRGVRIAIENMARDDFDVIEEAFARYGADFVGLCYDSGHGRIAGNGLDRLERFKDRLISVHLHDNDGVADKHWPPFTGKVDWERLARLIATSGYPKSVMSIESVMWHLDEEKDEEAFLRQVATAGARFAEMVEAQRRGAQRAGGSGPAEKK